MTPIERAVEAVDNYIGDLGASREIVTDVLQALREPSEAMVIDGQQYANGSSVRAIWQAMIDAALGEG